MVCGTTLEMAVVSATTPSEGPCDVGPLIDGGRSHRFRGDGPGRREQRSSKIPGGSPGALSSTRGSTNTFSPAPLSVAKVFSTTARNRCCSAGFTTPSAKLGELLAVLLALEQPGAQRMGAGCQFVHDHFTAVYCGVPPRAPNAFAGSAQ